MNDTRLQPKVVKTVGLGLLVLPECGIDTDRLDTATEGVVRNHCFRLPHIGGSVAPKI